MTTVAELATKINEFLACSEFSEELAGSKVHGAGESVAGIAVNDIQGNFFGIKIEVIKRGRGNE